MGGPSEQDRADPEGPLGSDSDDATLREKIEELEREVRAQRRAQGELRATRERLAAIVENSPNLISLKDPSGRYVLANAQLQAALGRTEEEILGRTDEELFSADVAAALREEDRWVIEQGSVGGRDQTLHTTSGTREYLSAVFPLRDPVTGVESVCRISTDVSQLRAAERERRELESRLLHTQKLESLGVLAGGIAHDFNNLLMGVLGHAHLARENVAPEDRRTRDSIAEIERAARRAADLCRRLLAYSSKDRFALSHVNLSELVQEMLDLLSVSTPHGVTVRPELARSLPLVEADASQIRQIVMHLVTNANEAMAERTGSISVVTNQQHHTKEELEAGYESYDLQPGEYVYLEVSDEGVGIDAEVLERIFDPFFTTKFTARGLGLSAVRSFVRGHRGGLRVSAQPDVGTTIRVLLPAVAEDLGVEPPPPDPSAEAAGHRVVLVADDEPTVLELAQRGLSDAGYEVLLAKDGRETVEVFTANLHRIEVVLLDLTMPGLSGEPVFRRLRQLQPRLRIIVSSGYDEHDARARFEGQALTGFLQKPYTRSELRAAIAAAVAQAPADLP